MTGRGGVTRRATAYLAKMPAAISGRGGHKATFKAALAMVRGFDLPTDVAFDLLATSFNLRCEPAWSEQELRHKIEEADKVGGPRGYLLNGKNAVRAPSRRVGEWGTATRGVAAIAVAERRRRAHVESSALWAGLGRRSPVGEAFLRNDRGIDPAPLIELDLTRFDIRGNPRVAIYDLTTGEIVGVAARMIGVKSGPGKVIVNRGATTDGSMIGKVGDLSPQGPNVAIVTEGVTDGLAAVQVWPNSVVLSAHSAHRFPKVVAAAAPLLHKIGGQLYLVADRNEAGINAGLAALDVAEAAGLVLGVDLHLVDLGPHNDLNDAVRAGWRPACPTT